MEIKNGYFTGERPLYNTHNKIIRECVFDDGESPLKESSDLKIFDTIFMWKYPLWYSKNIECVNVEFRDLARSGVWYTSNIKFINSNINVPKTFRRCDGVELVDTKLPVAAETFWNCKNIKLINTTSNGTYFGMNSENIYVENMDHNGDYLFDGCKNVVVRNSKIISKDSFWNCENVEIYDSYIEGEYFGWNTKNIKLHNCTIDSDQGMCYIEDLVMKDCILRNTRLSFELCKNIDATILSDIESVKNPISGVIKAKSIGEIILDKDIIDPSKTKIEVE